MKTKRSPIQTETHRFANNGALIVVLSVVGVYALYRIYTMRWVMDDAFISFRYALNLINGHGLVFNVGERVEGYTNFLWTVLIAGGMKLGFDPVQLSWMLGALSYVGTVAVFVFIAWRLSNQQNQVVFLPLAALGLLVHHESFVFGTGGLETSWVTWMVTLSFAILLLGRSTFAFASAGGVLTLAALTRPDAAIFLAAGLLYAAIIPNNRIRRILAIMTVPLLLYLPYWLWRYDYYGYPFPNTYYAKSASIPYYDQGLRYLWLYLKSYYVLWLVPVAIALPTWKLMRNSNSKKGVPQKLQAITGSRQFREIALAVLFLFPFLVYVVRVGGDFMFGRFFIPVTGIAFFTVESALRHSKWLPRSIYLSLLVFVALIVGRINIYDRIDRMGSIDGIGYAPALYDEAWHLRAKRAGGDLRPMFTNRDVRVAFFGTHAATVYYTQPSLAIEATTGLTDTFIAHQPLLQRGKPGHEKPAPTSYFFSRGVHFVYRNSIPDRLMSQRLRIVKFPRLKTFMITYDSELMDGLSESGEVEFTHFPTFLDSILVGSVVIPSSELKLFLAFSDQFYFDHNADVDRQSRLQLLVEEQYDP